VPTFLVDLYWDLRERHLLPLVVLAIVAIVAVPFLLGGGSKDQSATSTSPLSSAPSPEPAGAKLTVVEAKPGLRDPSKRLRADKPTDPFVQRYTSPVLNGTQLGNGEEGGGSTRTSSSTSTSTSTTTVTKTGEGSSGTTTESGSGQPSTGGGAEPGHLTLFAFAIDVKITRTEGGGNGSQPTSTSSTRHKVMPTTPLPGEKAPVVTYMGVGQGAKNALLMVSNNVKSTFGEAKCLSGTDTCQLLEIEPGFPETFVYGDNDVRYKINVLKIEPVLVGHG
jgi:hypothetical protein